ncbi:fibronectin type III domain protein [Parafrankia sp. EUN1f]|uniref:fibronectin type III domain protein n=1 Tax=Parafrankia sp. EUN1f TaxID=102897 RepID=UPI0001C4703E|nr:fibronectin type III domain protein [Parafrankia sp. EUN1f]EFC80515.1 Fibronectin type III domain protein [Parafrankia sp. EUN1f]
MLSKFKRWRTLCAIGIFSVLAPAIVACNPIGDSEGFGPWPAQFRYRIGATSSFTDVDGNVWAPDPGPSTQTSGGTIDYTPHSVPNTNNDALYATERWGVFSYHFTGLTPGVAVLHMYFRATWEAAEGQRVFDVVANGATIMDEFDIYKDSGDAAWTADEQDHDVTIGSDGVLDVSFPAATANYGVLSAIALSPAISGVPGLSSLSASDITASSAQLNAVIAPKNGTTSYHFEYGTTASYGSRVPASSDRWVSGTRSNATVAETVSGLSPSTTYHYRLVASNGSGSASSGDQTFTTPAATSSGRITRSGSQLRLNGAQYKFTGFNWYGAITGCRPGELPTAAEADAIFAALPVHTMVRVWAMPSGTSVDTARLAALDVIYNAAHAHGHYLDLVLENGLSDCTGLHPTYSATPSAAEIAWLDAVVTRHTDETVAIIEPANEANTGDANFKAWNDAMAARIKADNPNVLVGTGTGNNDSNQSVIQNYSSSSNIDLISYHGYSSPTNSCEARACTITAGAAAALNKPWYAGERGFCCGGGSTGTNAGNAPLLGPMYTAFLNNSTNAGVTYWDFLRGGTDPTSITPDVGGGVGSPMWNAFKAYSNPYHA